LRSASSCRAISQHLPRDRSWEVSAEAKALRSADGRTFERRLEIIDFARRKTYLCGGGLISPVPRGCDRFLEDCLRLWRRKLKADGLPREWFDGCDQAAVFIQPCLVLWMFVRKRVAVKRRRQSPEVVAAGEKPDVLQVIVYIRDQPVEHRWPPQLSGVAHKVLALGAHHIYKFGAGVLVIVALPLPASLASGGSSTLRRVRERSSLALGNLRRDRLGCSQPRSCGGGLR